MSNQITITSGPHAGESGIVIADIAPSGSEVVAHLVRLEDGRLRAFKTDEVKESNHEQQ